jgi:hypothetical protein
MNTGATVAVALAAAAVIIVVICAVSDFQVTGSFRIGKRNPPRQRKAPSQPPPGMSTDIPLDSSYVAKGAS